METWCAPIRIKGQFVIAELLSMAHLLDLKETIADGNLNNLWYTNIPSISDLEQEIKRRLGLYNEGLMVPFAVIDQKTKKAIGLTSFMNLDEKNRRLEIGSTWYSKKFQRTALNTECKLLLLQYAFEVFNCVCVEFRTHFINHQSRKSIERLGAKLDGVLRSNAIMQNGSLSDTAVYSIIQTEWPMVKVHLNFELNKPRALGTSNQF